MHPVSVPSQGEEDPDKLKCITYSYIANQEIIKEYAKHNCKFYAYYLV